jgi:alpha-N-arabinofuranosidase
VRLACIAQMVNVLQAVLLTEGEKMIKTPTYHIFHMYRHHQGAELLDSSITGIDEVGIGEWKVPQITESVSEKDGIITITLNNLSLEGAQELDIQLADATGYQVIEASVVTDGDIHAHNTFEEPERVVEKPFNGYTKNEKGFAVKLPANSVVAIRIAK